jgi:hypothetical protein
MHRRPQPFRVRAFDRPTSVLDFLRRKFSGFPQRRLGDEQKLAGRRTTMLSRFKDIRLG